MQAVIHPTSCAWPMLLYVSSNHRAQGLPSRFQQLSWAVRSLRTAEHILLSLSTPVTEHVYHVHRLQLATLLKVMFTSFSTSNSS